MIGSDFLGKLWTSELDFLSQTIEDRSKDSRYLVVLKEW